LNVKFALPDTALYNLPFTLRGKIWPINHFRTSFPITIKLERATSIWYRIAGLIGQRDIALDIIEAEIRSAQHEVLLEAERLVVTGISGPSIAKALRDRAEQTIRPGGGSR